MVIPDTEIQMASSHHERAKWWARKRKSTDNDNRANKTSGCRIFGYASELTPFLNERGPESGGESPCRPRSERIRGPEKSRATNGVWQRIISPRLRTRRNNRFLFPSFAAQDLPCFFLVFRRDRVHRKSNVPSYPVPDAQSYGFALGTLLSWHRHRRTKQAARRWFARSSVRKPDLESSRMHM